MGKIILLSILIIYLLVSYKYLAGKSNTEQLLKLLFLYVFIYGVLEYYKFPDFTRKFFIDILILILCFIQFQKANFRFPGIKWFLAFTVLFFISTIITSSGLYPSFTYFRTFFYPYIVFLLVFNLKMEQNRWHIFNKFIFSLFILQIFASIFKYVFIGVNEKFLIGTVSISGGAFSTMLPLIALAFIFSFFMVYKQDNKYIILAIGFLFMGYTGAKRGLWLYLPIILLITLYAYRKVTGVKIISKKLIGISFFLLLFSFFTVIFGSKYTTTLNPDNKVGGRFDLGYLKEYSVDYTFASSNSDNYSNGRGANLITVINKMKNDYGINFILGYGPESGEGIRTYGEGIWKYLGVNGPITGFTYHLVQLGLLTNILLIISIIKIAIYLFRLSKFESDLYWKSFSFAGFIVSIVFIIDFVTYSSSFISTIFPLSFSFAYINGICLKRFMVYDRLFSKKFS